MRIGIDARLVYYHKAGIGQYILRLVEALAKVNTEDEFIIWQSRKDHEPIVNQPNFQHRPLWTPSHHRFEQITLPLELATGKMDVLHSPDFIPPFRRNYRSVITIHDLAFLLYPQFLTRESARYYGQIDQAVRHTDAIIAVSESTKRDVMRLLGVPADKIVVVYEAANPIFRPISNAELVQWVGRRYRIGGDFILFVSTIEPRKNVSTLLRAYHRLLRDYRPSVKLVLAGATGWLFQDVLDLVAELGLRDDVLFLGHVTAEELLWLYNAARVLVHPAFYEGFGLTPLEAMACGTPVIVSNVSSLPEVVGDAGLFVAPEDVEGWTVAIWRVLSEADLRAQLREKGLRRARVFSWKRAALQTLEVYRRVTG
ncbi:MAG: glycosyltransferase family 4 protein [Chloroflexi bacterium]|nr:glycosyltransferase family 4 protein [Chloroflexota bacterium]